MIVKLAGSRDFYPTINGKEVDISTLPDESCDMIVLNNTAEYLDLKDIGPFLKLVVSKTKMGGKVLLGGSDCLEVSRLMFTNQINIEVFNNLLMSGRKSAWCLVTMKNLFEQVGLTPLTVILGGIGGCDYLLSGVRL